MNVWHNPAEQENIVSRLKFCEVLAALGSLARGGSLILLYYTIFENSSIGLLYLLRLLFEHVSLQKPFSSKEGTSEMYIVCSGLRREGRELREYALQMFDAMMDQHE